MIKQFIVQLVSTVISFLRCAFYSNYHNRFKLNREKQNNTCIILANGPSLNESIANLAPSNIYDFFAVNFFVLSDYFFRLKPKCYVFADSAFWDQEENLHPETIVQREEMVKRFECIDWPMTIFLPGKGLNCLLIKKLKNNNANLSFVPYNTTSFKGFEPIKEWSYKQNLCMPISQNVLIAALYLSINMGYEDIEVYGGDFSWTKSIRVDKNNIVCQIDSHFYDKKEVKLSPVLAYVGRPYHMHNILGDYAKMFEGCWQVRFYADSLGVKIINKNPESFIDAFDKE